MCPKAGEVKTLPKAKMLRDGKRKVGTPTENDNTGRKSQVENLAGRKMVGPGGLERLTSSVSNPPPTAGIRGIHRLGRTRFGSHWHFLVRLGVLCATLCATKGRSERGVRIQWQA